MPSSASLPKIRAWLALSALGLIGVVGFWTFFTDRPAPPAHPPQATETPPDFLAAEPGPSADDASSRPASEASQPLSPEPPAPPEREPPFAILETLDETVEPVRGREGHDLRKRLLRVRGIDPPIVVEDVVPASDALEFGAVVSAYKANRLLVRWNEGAQKMPPGQRDLPTGWSRVGDVGESGFVLIRSDEQTLEGMRKAEARIAARWPSAERERDALFRAAQQSVPNDPAFAGEQQWGLSNPRENGPDINAPAGWAIRSQAPNVVVAVVDTGINLQHEDLKANLWTNPAEIAGNGVDDDGNGYVDDVHGINLVGGGPPDDDNGHGSSMAGIIGAVGDNGIGMAGVCWEVQLMAVKFLNQDGYGALSDAIKAIDYASSMGANVINASWGGFDHSQALREAIQRAGERGAIVVASAGNDHMDLDTEKTYPASYDLDALITVAAIGEWGNLLYSSNYGTSSVPIAAPGHRIHSTEIGSVHAYGSRTGTSQAAAFVSGVMALLSEHFPDATPKQQIDRLIAYGRPLPILFEQTASSKIPDLRAALTMTEVPVLPHLEAESPFIAYADSGQTFQLEAVDWTAPFAETAYQWRHEDVPLEGETETTLQREASEDAAGQYRLVATNRFGEDSLEFELKVYLEAPELANLLGFPNGNFLALPELNWQVFEDEEAAGGQAVRIEAERWEFPALLKLRVPGPGQIRFRSRHFTPGATGWLKILHSQRSTSLTVGNDWNRGVFDLSDEAPQTVQFSFGTFFPPTNTPTKQLAIDSLAFYREGELPPLVTRPKSGLYFREGRNAQLHFYVSHTDHPTEYEFFKDGKSLGTREGPYLQLGMATEETAGVYQLVARNEFGSDASNPIPVEILAGPPRFIYEDGETFRRVLSEGQSLRLAPGHFGSLDLAYQWRLNNVPLEGMTEPELVVDPITPFSRGSYQLEIWYPSTGEKAISKSYWVDVHPAKMRPRIAIVGGFAEENRPILRKEGDPLVVEGEADGSRPMSYQWFRDGEPIGGATAWNLDLGTAALDDSGVYHVVARNDYGIAESKPVSVEVYKATDLTELLDADLDWQSVFIQHARAHFDPELKGGSALLLQPAIRSRMMNYDSMTFAVEGSGILEFSLYAAEPESEWDISIGVNRVQVYVGNARVVSESFENGWQRLAIPVEGEESVVEIRLMRGHAAYFLLDDFHIDRSARISRHPLDLVAAVGAEPALSVFAHGRPPLSYQWSKDGVPIEGATEAELRFPSLEMADEGLYRVAVRNSEGEVISDEARVSTQASLQSLLGLEGVDVSTGGPAPWSAREDGTTLSSGRGIPGSWLEFRLEGPGYLTFDYFQDAPTEVSLNGEFYHSMGRRSLGHSLEWRGESIKLRAGPNVVRIETEDVYPFFLRNPTQIRNLQVGVYPAFAESPQDAMFLPGDDAATLEAMFWFSPTSPRPERFVWRRDGETLPEDAAPDIGELVSRLHLGQTGEPLDGIYHCVAVFPNGDTVSSAAAEFETLAWVEEAAASELSGARLQSGPYALPERWVRDEDVYVEGSGSLRFDLSSSLKLVASASGTLTFWAKTEGLYNESSLSLYTPNPYSSILIRSDRDWTRYEIPIVANEQGVGSASITASLSYANSRGGHVWLDGFRFDRRPFFIEQPESVAYPLDQEVAFQAVAHSDSPPSYQWLKDGEPIPGATQPTLTLPRVDTVSAGSYVLEATNEEGTRASQPATLSLEGSIAYAAEAPYLAIETGGGSLWSVDSGFGLDHDRSIVSGDLGRSYIAFDVVGPTEIGLFANAGKGVNAAVLFNGESSGQSIYAPRARWSFEAIRVPSPGLTRVTIVMPESEDPHVSASERRLRLDRIHVGRTIYADYGQWIGAKADALQDPNQAHWEPFADIDRDGILNVWEYLVTDSPSSFAGLPRIKLASENNLAFRNIRARVRRDYQLALFLETSRDLRRWHPVEPCLVESPSSADPSQMEVEWRLDREENGKPIFFRWKARQSGPLDSF